MCERVCVRKRVSMCESVCVCVCERVFLISADYYIVTVYFLFAPREDDDFLKAPKQKTSKVC